MRKAGKKVFIINQDFNGNALIEGEAVLKRFIKYIDGYMATDNELHTLEMWDVKFIDADGLYTRTIYPDCDVEYVKSRKNGVIE